jgi:tRNA(Ile)-lysidine synthase
LRDALSARVWEAVREHGLFGPGEKVVVGVSGGPDSTALAHVLSADEGGLGLRLHLAHLNHGWRGVESDRDEKAARDLARGLGLSLTVSRLPKRQPAKERTEESAREQRYEFLRRVAAEVGAAKVCVGHTADDQVETVLLNMFRGAGPLGMGGMPFLKGGWLARPLLGVWREGVEEYCAEHGLSCVEDSSNRDQRFARNWVRGTLLPLLVERLGPKVKDNILRAGRLAGEVSQALEAWEDDWMAGVCRRVEGEVRLRVEALEALPEAMRLAVLHRGVRMVSEGAKDVGMVHLRALEGLCRERAGSKELHLPHGLVARREYGILRVERCSSGAPRCGDHWGPVRVAVPGQTLVPEAGILVVARQTSGKTAYKAVQGEGRGKSEIALDKEAVRLPLWVRSWRPGDRMEPRGMRGSKKLQDLFVDARLPASERRRVPIVADDTGRIVWVAGLRLARGVEAAQESRRAIRLAVQPVGNKRQVGA